MGVCQRSCVFVHPPVRSHRGWTGRNDGKRSLNWKSSIAQCDRNRKMHSRLWCDECLAKFVGILNTFPATAAERHAELAHGRKHRLGGCAPLPTLRTKRSDLSTSSSVILSGARNGHSRRISWSGTRLLPWRKPLPQCWPLGVYRREVSWCPPRRSFNCVRSSLRSG